MREKSFGFLALLTRLRQTCCDPDMLPWLKAPLSDSGKINLLIEKLTEIVGSGHKVVIFSQFVMLLDRVRTALAEKFPELTHRIYDEGHEIGNHTFSHPDISNISNFLMRLELNSTERLFEAKLGIKPLFFRPPYSIDAEPDTAEQVEPLRLTQDMGYITVGAKLDPNDWRTTPRRTPQARPVPAGKLSTECPVALHQL